VKDYLNQWFESPAGTFLLPVKSFTISGGSVVFECKAHDRVGVFIHTKGYIDSGSPVMPIKLENITLFIKR